jgi:acyl carrier protein
MASDVVRPLCKTENGSVGRSPVVAVLVLAPGPGLRFTTVTVKAIIRQYLVDGVLIWKMRLISCGNLGGDLVETITDEVRQIISKQLKIPLERLTPDTALRDLGVESLDLIEIIFALEEKFDITIPYNANEVAAAGKGESSRDELRDLETVAQISAAVKALMDAKASA